MIDGTDQSLVELIGPLIVVLIVVDVVVDNDYFMFAGPCLMMTDDQCSIANWIELKCLHLQKH